MNICEIFGPTIQGEGPWIRKPVIFIRMLGCIKPYCLFCDTTYSWNDENNNNTSKDMEIDEIMNEIKKYNCENIVISGGEPYAQEEIYKLINELTNNSYKVQIETSGKAPIKYKGKELIVCSPKWYEDGIYLINKGVMEHADHFKFVIGNMEEFSYAMKFIMQRKLQLDKCDLMPLTTNDTDKNLEIQKFVWTLCAENNINYSPRLHVDIFGNKRGV